MKKNHIVQIVLASSFFVSSLFSCSPCNTSTAKFNTSSICPFKDPKLIAKNKHSNFKDTTYLNYRGERKVISTEKLCISDFSITQLEDNSVVFEIKFNQSINPLSLAKSYISINKVELDESADIRYNKKADTISIQIPYQEYAKRIDANTETVTVEISNIQSFDGKSVTDKISGYFSLK